MPKEPHSISSFQNFWLTDDNYKSWARLATSYCNLSRSNIPITYAILAYALRHFRYNTYRLTILFPTILHYTQENFYTCRF